LDFGESAPGKKAVAAKTWSVMSPMFTRPGKPTKSDGKSPALIGKSTINGAIFNSYVKLPEGKHGKMGMYPKKNG